MKQIISTEQAPAAIGPYSQAVQVPGLLFLAGQIGLDPASGELVGDDVSLQARQVMHNLRAVLAAAGATLDQLVKTTIYLTDLSDFAEVNAVYAEFFSSEPPARATVEVSGLPRGARVEIEGVAVW